MTRRSAVRGAAGYFAVGIWHPKTGVNVGSLWRSATLYGAAFVFTVGRRYKRQASDTTGTISRVPLLHFADVPDLVGHLPHGCPLIAVEMTPFSVPLYQFAHPARAAYLLGAEDHGLPPAVSGRCHDRVVVEAPAREPMNVACAGSVILHDRYVKAATA
jgi:tRNA G18 (ribose-2'-O)-methylase SpoU